MARDAAFAALAEEIDRARAALIAVISQEPTQWWPAYDLKMRARNGWSGSVMSLALQRLVEDGAIEVDGERVRLQQ